MFRKWIFLVVVALNLSFFINSGLIYAAEQRLMIASGTIGDTSCPLAGWVAKIITEHVPQTQASALFSKYVPYSTSNISTQNIKYVGSNKVHFATVTSDTAYFAYNGEGEFKDQRKWDNIRGVFSTYPTEAMFFALEGNGIKCLADLHGKRVAVGLPGSATESFNRMVLQIHGLTYSHIQAQFISATEAIAALQKGTSDAAMYLLRSPSPILMDLAARRKIHFLSMDTDTIAKFCELYPFYTPYNVKIDTYKYQDENINTVQSYGLFITNKDMEDNLVYEIVKRVFENKNELDKITIALKQLKMEATACNMPIPLHPGAERYFQEQGFVNLIN